MNTPAANRANAQRHSCRPNTRRPPRLGLTGCALYSRISAPGRGSPGLQLLPLRAATRREALPVRCQPLLLSMSAANATPSSDCLIAPDLSASQSQPALPTTHACTLPPRKRNPLTAVASTTTRPPQNVALATRTQRAQPAICQRDTVSYMSVALSVRLPDEISQSLDAYASDRSLNRSTVIVRALSEWIRLQSHPGIRFVSLVNGDRVAALERGPEVWTVAEAWVTADPGTRSVDEIAHVTGLTATEVEHALRYYADFQDEIDAEMARVWQAQKEEQAAWNRLRSTSVR